MHLGQHWWNKKEAPLYLLDVAILLALFRGINLDLSEYGYPSKLDIFQESTLGPYGHLPSDYYANNFKVQRLLMNTQHENISSELRSAATNNSVPQHLRNITVNMVLVSSIDLEDNLTLNHSLPTLAEQDAGIDQGGFSFENLLALQGWNNSNNVSETSTNSNNFTNAEDVRWQQYLNIDDTEASQKHCDSAKCSEKDISKSESFNSIASSSFYEASKETLDISDFFDATGPFEAVTATDPNIPGTSHGKGVSLDIGNSFFHTNDTIGKEDSDLMQMLYEQDADLGYNNWQRNEPLKQLKEIDDIQKVKNDLLDVTNFFIDGETGEQIPIPPNQAPIPQQQISAPVLPQYQTPLNNNPVGGNNGINIEECLEILEHSMDDNGPQRCNQNTVVEHNPNIVRNLTSLIDANGNATAMTAPNADLWQQIDELQEMTGLNLQEPVMPQPQNELNGNFNYNIPMPAVEARSMNQQLNYSPVAYNGMGQAPNNSPSFGSPVSQAFPISNFPNNAQSPPLQTASSYMSPPMISDDGIPMDTTFSPMGSPDKQEPKFPVNNFNNFNYDASPLGEGNPALTSLPEPGQSFFDYLQPEGNVAADFAPTSSAMTSYSTQSNAPYLNPPVVSYPPPPLNPSTSAASFMDMSSTGDKNSIMEAYESDSGISLDQSPRGLEFLTLNPTDETAYTDLSIIKTEPNDQDIGFAPELKSIHHNHTYNGTIGVKKQDRYQNDKSLLPRESRDEKKARELNLPFSLEEIILSPVEEYNELLARTPLTPSQQALVKDIRRRGKNKVAAQNCRKRKIETITSMEEDVDLMRSKKQQLVEEQKELEIKYESMKLRYSSLYEQIFSSLRDDTGRPYDPSHFRLEQVERAVLLVPNMGQGEKRGEEGSASGAEVEYSNVKMEKRH